MAARDIQAVAEEIMEYRRAMVRILFPTAVFTGAFLSFLIQPVAGKILTPQYGGSAVVWCICILFFQGSLLVGYGFAAFLNLFRRRSQFLFTIILFSLGILALRIPPAGPEWAPLTFDSPGQSLLYMMASYLMFPCVMLSMVSVLVQNWYHRIEASPYHLYGISNAGSLLGLLIYPLLVEPFVTVTTTVRIWEWLYVALALTMSATALVLFRNSSSQPELPPDRSAAKAVAPGPADYGKWLLLSLGGTALLVSTTAAVTMDIAPVPLLWVPVLGVYLLTFILCFSRRRFYRRKVFLIASQVVIVVNVFLPDRFSEGFPLFGIMNSLTLLFLLCMVCHGELTRTKPHPRFLPRYYLSIASGGVLSGVAINFLAPTIFSEPIEHALVVSSAGWCAVYLTLRSSIAVLRRPGFRYLYALTALPLLGLPAFQSLRGADSVVHSERNFYNAASVVRNSAADALGLYSGRTIHGFQLTDPAKSRVPTGYYAADSAIGILNSYIRRSVSGRALRVAVIGLGAGTIAAYGQPGDTLVFYEIDPKVKSIAQSHFTFLRQSQAQIDVRLGDARRLLTEESAGRYDLLVVDAFNGDSIPYHLLTREAMSLYMSHLAEGGAIVLHVTNHYLDLATVVNNVALSMNLQSTHVHTRRGANRYGAESRYVVVSRGSSPFQAARLAESAKELPNVTVGEMKRNSRLGVWTDDYINVLGALIL